MQFAILDKRLLMLTLARVAASNLRSYICMYVRAN